MAADSSVTHIQKQTGLAYAVPNSAQKLHIIPYLNAGVSCWGLGTIGEIGTDQWLKEFIASNNDLDSITKFATKLASRLNDEVLPNTSGKNRLGFHIAAFEDHDGTPTPSFYHVHDGPSEVLQERGIKIDPHKFNANYDIPPEIFLDRIASGFFPITRNGDYHLYARIFDLLEGFFQQLQPSGIIIPNSQNLIDRAQYLVFQIRTVSEIYRLSNLVPGIGGGILHLTINQNGIHSHGISY
jgi:hypothetical protein